MKTKEKNQPVTLKDTLAQLSTQINRLNPREKPGQKEILAAKAVAAAANRTMRTARAELIRAKLSGEKPALDHLEMTKTNEPL